MCDGDDLVDPRPIASSLLVPARRNVIYSHTVSSLAQYLRYFSILNKTVANRLHLEHGPWPFQCTWYPAWFQNRKIHTVPYG
jgi:hypothetical protein